MDNFGRQPGAHRYQAPDGREQRQLVEANKSTVGVAMQFLVFVDKIHDMQQRNVVSKEDQIAFSAWALECAYATCGITSAGRA